MPVNETTSISYLYEIEYGSSIYGFTDLANVIEQEDSYTPIQIVHSRPRFSARAEDAEIDITMSERAELTNLFIDPPLFSVKVRIYEYDSDDGSITPYYRGWVVRAPFKLTESLLVLHCKSAWHYYERDSLVDSLSSLSRYSIYDPRSGVDIEALKTTVTVDSLNEFRDVLTVTGITQLDDYFRGGVIRAPDGDLRGILKHVTESGDVNLYLTSAFPEFTLSTGFTADIFPGDDLKYETWANKFAAVTNNGENHGGWPYTPDHDPAVRGVS